MKPYVNAEGLILEPQYDINVMELTPGDRVYVTCGTRGMRKARGVVRFICTAQADVAYMPSPFSVDVVYMPIAVEDNPNARYMTFQYAEEGILHDLASVLVYGLTVGRQPRVFQRRKVVEGAPDLIKAAMGSDIQPNGLAIVRGCTVNLTEA